MDREQFDYTQSGNQPSASPGMQSPFGRGPAVPPGGRVKKSPVLAGVVGCVGGVVVLLLVLGGIAAFVYGIFALMRNSDSYQEAVRRAQEHQEVRQVLGEPVEPGWYLTGSVSSGQGTGQAKLRIPLSGPLGRGTLVVESRTEAGQLRFRVLTLEVSATRERLNLLRD
jgi:hypothetical protein